MRLKKAKKKWLKKLNSKGYAGYYDWRLPTLEEAISLLESSKKNGDLCIDLAFDKRQSWIWTGDRRDKVSARLVQFTSINDDDNYNYGGVRWDDGSYYAYCWTIFR